MTRDEVHRAIHVLDCYYNPNIGITFIITNTNKIINYPYLSNSKSMTRDEVHRAIPVLDCYYFPHIGITFITNII